MTNKFVVPNDCKEREVREIAIKLLEHIIEKKEIIQYGELCNKLSFEMNPRNIEKPLGNISFACKENGLPPISVMVVNKDTMMPGNGFYEAYFPELKTEEQKMKKCFETMNEVKNFKGWEDVLQAFIDA